LGIYKCDDTFKDLRTAVIDGIGGATKVEKFLAVGTSHAYKPLGYVSTKSTSRGLCVMLTCCCWTIEQTMQARRPRAGPFIVVVEK